MGKLADLQLGNGALKPFSFEFKRQNGTIAKVRVAVRVLGKGEWDLVKINARLACEGKDARAQGKALEELIEDQRIVEALAIALRDPDKPDEPWATPLEIDALPTPVISLLWNVYDEHQGNFGLLVTELSAEQYDALIETVAEEATCDPFLLFAPPMRNAFVITMARELRSYRMQSSSGISESGAPKSGSENSSEHDESPPASSRRDDVLDSDWPSL
jgi:hypothetical protein